MFRVLYLSQVQSSQKKQRKCVLQQQNILPPVSEGHYYLYWPQLPTNDYKSLGVSDWGILLAELLLLANFVTGEQAEGSWWSNCSFREFYYRYPFRFSDEVLKKSFTNAFYFHLPIFEDGKHGKNILIHV